LLLLICLLNFLVVLVFLYSLIKIIVFNLLHHFLIFFEPIILHILLILIWIYLIIKVYTLFMVVLGLLWILIIRISILIGIEICFALRFNLLQSLQKRT
jgi:hypothetical protein